MAWHGRLLATRQIDYLLVIVTLFFAIFLTLCSYGVLACPLASAPYEFWEFLKSNIRIGRGTMSGREVFFEIALIPVALAFGANSYRSCLGDLRLSA